MFATDTDKTSQLFLKVPSRERGKLAVTPKLNLFSSPCFLCCANRNLNPNWATFAHTANGFGVYCRFKKGSHSELELDSASASQVVGWIMGKPPCPTYIKCYSWASNLEAKLWPESLIPACRRQSRLTWSTPTVPRQPGLQRETLSQKSKQKLCLFFPVTGLKLWGQSFSRLILGFLNCKSERFCHFKIKVLRTNLTWHV